MMKKRKLLALAGALMASTLVLTACGPLGTNQDPDASITSPFNEADIEFAQMMIPHHEGAINMAQVAGRKDGVDRQVADLAQRIQEAQGPEIDQLTHLLDTWGAETDMPGMDHGMDGMTSEDDMAALETATGAETGRIFLEQMIVHHQGAIEMAQTELDEGENPEAQAMAQAIIDAQETEIGEMQEILVTL